MTPVLFVAAAVAGALGRYGTTRLVCSWQALLVVNTIGSGLFGLLVANEVEPWVLTVVGTGFCGTFTTFSSFAWELRREGWRFAVWYAPLTVACAAGAASIGATF